MSDDEPATRSVGMLSDPQQCPTCGHVTRRTKTCVCGCRVTAHRLDLKRARCTSCDCPGFEEATQR